MKIKRIISLAIVFMFILSLNAFAAVDSKNVEKDNLNYMTQEEALKFYEKNKDKLQKNRILISSVTELDMARKKDLQNLIEGKFEKSYVEQFNNRVNELKKKSTQELKEMGYSDARILQLQSNSLVVGDQEIGSTLSMWLTTYNFNNDVYIGSTKYATVFTGIVEWQWSDAPINNHNDAVAISWAGSQKLLYDASYHSTYVTYLDETSGQNTYVYYNSQAVSGLDAAHDAVSYEFPMLYSTYKWAERGFYMFRLRNKDLKATQVDLGWGYAHSITLIAGTIAVDGSSSGASIDFGYGFGLALETGLQENTWWYGIVMN